MEMGGNMEGGPRLRLSSTNKTRLGEDGERRWRPDGGCVSVKW